MLKQSKRTGGLLATAAALALVMFLVLPLAATGGKPDKPPGKDKEPPPSPGTGEIAFSRGSWGDAELVVRNLDTGTETVLVSSAADPCFRSFFRSTWSHTEDEQGRRWIVFDAAVPSLPDPTRWTDEIWAVMEDGTDLHVVLPSDDPNLPSPVTPALSPDDGWLAFTVYKADLGVDNIYIQRFDAVRGCVTGTPIQLTPDLFWTTYHATWSPDGLSIAFVVEETRESEGDIWRLDLVYDEFGQPSMLDLVDLTNTPTVNEWTPDWSDATDVWPLGRIAFKAYPAIMHMDPDGSDVQIVVYEEPRSPRLPSWSPQASRIAFGAIGKRRVDVFTVNPDGSGLVNMTDTQKVSEIWPAWRP